MASCKANSRVGVEFLRKLLIAGQKLHKLRRNPAIHLNRWINNCKINPNVGMAFLCQVKDVNYLNIRRRNASSKMAMRM